MYLNKAINQKEAALDRLENTRIVNTFLLSGFLLILPKSVIMYYLPLPYAVNWYNLKVHLLS